MKLIFVNRYFDPDFSATSQILSDLAFHLAKVGHEVHVVTSRQLYDDPGACLPAAERIRGVTVHRVWSSRFGRQALAGRALDYASFYAGASMRLIRLAHCGDLIIAKTDPPLISVLAGWAARLRGARLVNWLQDLYPEVAEGLGIFSPNKPSSGLLRGLRDRSLRQAVMNVTVGSRMARRLEIQAVEHGRIRIIGNWTDDESVRPIPIAENPLRHEWGLEGRFVVGYSGNLGRAHEFETLLGAAERLRSHQDVVFLFIGSGHHIEGLRAAFASRGLQSLQVRPYQPQVRLACSLSLPDVHWISLRPELEGLIVPSKFYGIAAAGRPIIMIGDPDGEIGTTVRDVGCGFPVAKGDDLDLASAILQLKNDPALCETMGRRARRLLEDRFTRAAALQLWQDLIGGLAAGEPNRQSDAGAEQPQLAPSEHEVADEVP